VFAIGLVDAEKCGVVVHSASKVKGFKERSRLADARRRIYSRAVVDDDI
jgi:hypothetical protein